ncbi:carbonic anhydrase [Naasia sp. SYSU D00948]|uniref:carbonic anhydrase n=1 Tax=Naasia sp. SYSU D00948 TaxID=2817379 RepID=UPI001B31563A|nr:carbonic anhydrase [Naasia sp. SYSU D00948]
MHGNERFVRGEPSHPRQDVERRAELAHVQHPSAALLGCSDSRLAAEIIFDTGLGDLFVVRNAGQVVSDSAVASLEYAVAVLKVPLIVVLAHDECGAVRAAIDSQGGEAPPLPPLIRRHVEGIVPAVRAIGVVAEDGTIDPDAIDVAEVGRRHLRNTVAELMARSELISQAIADGSLAVVGAHYRLAEGRAGLDLAVGDVRRTGDVG